MHLTAIGRDDESVFVSITQNTRTPYSQFRVPLLTLVFPLDLHASHSLNRDQQLDLSRLTPQPSCHEPSLKSIRHTPYRPRCVSLPSLSVSLSSFLWGQAPKPSWLATLDSVPNSPQGWEDLRRIWVVFNEFRLNGNHLYLCFSPSRLPAHPSCRSRIEAQM